MPACLMVVNSDVRALATLPLEESMVVSEALGVDPDRHRPVRGWDDIEGADGGCGIGDGFLERDGELGGTEEAPVLFVGAVEADLDVAHAGDHAVDVVVAGEGDQCRARSAVSPMACIHGGEENQEEHQTARDFHLLEML
ncbi:hypothetical protein BJF96_g9395 [Verticillium dahliae]|uniref:Uncharacterized protein n=1 Tax=Verticillium dahliae TaxID=27337 RepID=A0AA45AHM4_VERDA|nr:hypothetical protein BJF96_g9395 [Verticillium dahliae]